MNREHDDLEFEFKTTSKLKLSKKNGESELLCFTLPLFGGIELSFIVTIPGQNEDKAPVYVKVRRARKTVDRNNQRAVNNNY